MNINIHATVSSNSLGYYRYMRANYSALTSTENNVKFFLYCLDPQSARSLERDPAHTVVPLSFGRGSGGHASAIEAALRRLSPGEINIVADTDVVLLSKDWDRRIVDAMMGQRRLGIIGTRLEDIGGFSSGNTKYQQYKKKPTTTWMALSPRYDFSKLKVLPDKNNVIEVTTDELSRLYNLPIGYFVVKDTGWQIPSYLEEHNIPYLAFDIVKPTSSEAQALKGTSPYHDEFHWDGVAFLAHQRGSMTHRFRIDPLSCDFYDACDRYLANPSWSVYPTAVERAKVPAQNLIRRARRIAGATLRRLKVI
jgi:hypothetical protein